MCTYRFAVRAKESGMIRGKQNGCSPRQGENRRRKLDGDLAIATESTRSVADYPRREEATAKKAEG